MILVVIFKIFVGAFAPTSYNVASPLDLVDCLVLVLWHSL